MLRFVLSIMTIWKRLVQSCLSMCQVFGDTNARISCRISHSITSQDIKGQRIVTCRWFILVSDSSSITGASHISISAIRTKRVRRRVRRGITGEIEEELRRVDRSEHLDEVDGQYRALGERQSVTPTIMKICLGHCFIPVLHYEWSLSSLYL